MNVETILETRLHAFRETKSETLRTETCCKPRRSSRFSETFLETMPSLQPETFHSLPWSGTVKRGHLDEC
jgi:hypothetical protein